MCAQAFTGKLLQWKLPYIACTWMHKDWLVHITKLMWNLIYSCLAVFSYTDRFWKVFGCALVYVLYTCTYKLGKGILVAWECSELWRCTWKSILALAPAATSISSCQITFWTLCQSRGGWQWTLWFRAIIINKVCLISLLHLFNFITTGT